MNKINTEYENELKELGKRIRNILIPLLIIFVIVFLSNPLKMKIGIQNSFSVMIFHIIYSNLPHGFSVIAITPFEAIMVDVKLSLLISLVIIMPWILFQISLFIGPALYSYERKLLILSIIPVIMFFITGFLFASTLIVPLIFKFADALDISMGILPTVSASSFVLTIFIIDFSMGLSFEIPMFMLSLTYLGIISSDQIKNNWRYGIAGSFVMALVISPGATGGLMETIIGLTISGLYFLGYTFSIKVEKWRVKNNENMDM